MVRCPAFVFVCDDEGADVDTPVAERDGIGGRYVERVPMVIVLDMEF
jgi:hypothetical protein